MVVNVVKNSKILGRLASTLQDTRVQKTAENAVSEVVTETKSKLQLPSTRSAIEYFTSGNKKPSAATKINPELSPREIFLMKVKELTALSEQRESDKLSESYIRMYAYDIDDEKYRRLKEILYIEARGKHQILSQRFADILKLSKERYDMFFQMININGRKEGQQFNDYSLLKFVENTTAEKFEKAKNFFYIAGRGKDQFNLYEIEELSEHTPEQIERLKKLGYIPGRKNQQLNYDEIRKVNLNLNNHDFNNLLDLLSLNSEHTPPLAPDEISDIISNDKFVNRYKKLFGIKEHDKNPLWHYYIKSFSKELSDIKFEQLEQLLHVEKFKDEQLSPSEIVKILKEKDIKRKQIINCIKDENLIIDLNTFRKLIKCKNINTIASLIKKCPDRNPKDVVDICRDFSVKEIKNLEYFLINFPKYHIKDEGFAIQITNKQNTSSLVIFKEGTCGFNYDYIFLYPGNGRKCNYINMVQNSEESYITRGITDFYPSSETIFCISKNNRTNLERLYNAPSGCSTKELWEFIETGDFKTKKILESELKKFGHATFQTAKGSSQYKYLNGTQISQLDTTASKDAQRITLHYPNGRIAVNDWDLDISTTLEPNKTNNGMRIIKILGDKKIDLTSVVQDDIIILTDNLTGKQASLSVDDIVQRDFISKEDNFIKIPISQKKQAVLTLMKELSPTTILNLLKFKNTKPDANFPFIKRYDTIAAYFDNQQNVITLTDSPQTVSHETLHAITHILNLLNDKELIKLHTEEAKNTSGILRYMAEYAADGQRDDYERGLNELISIMGTFNEYGVEISHRAETTRVAFPKTTKAIEKKLMDYYQKTIQEVFNN